MEKKSFFISIIAILIFSLIGGAFLFFQLKKGKKVQAGSGENVYGWAWSENIGWISFNSINCDPDDDGLSNGEGACPPAGEVIPDYGVQINEDGSLTGYAWSENIGWISFNRSETGAPPGAPDYGTYIAKVDLDTKEVFGWARACGILEGEATITCGGEGWDGWIKLRNDPGDGGEDYGVWIDTSVSPHQFRGWAWGSEIVGWISFNHLNCDSDGDGISDTGNYANCPVGESLSEYQVVTSFTFNQPPTVSDAQDPDHSENYCIFSAGGLGQVSFQWQYNDEDGDQEIGFDFQIDNNPDFSSPEVDRSVSGLSNSPPAINTQTVQVRTTSTTPGGDYLTYNTTYYWRVRVYDNQGNDSGWYFDPLDPIFSFTTDSHAWPWPYFEFSPENPIVGEVVNFTDTSTTTPGLYATCYYADNTPYPCRNEANSYLWSFGDGETSTTRGETSHIYEEIGTYSVKLRIRDYLNPAYECEIERPLNLSTSLPEWQEIPPY